MTNYQGFSLTEVLVSLLLISSTSLALLHQQLQMSQLLNQALKRSLIAAELENNRESTLEDQPVAKNKSKLVVSSR